MYHSLYFFLLVNSDGLFKLYSLRITQRLTMLSSANSSKLYLYIREALSKPDYSVVITHDVIEPKYDKQLEIPLIPITVTLPEGSYSDSEIKLVTMLLRMKGYVDVSFDLEDDRNICLLHKPLELWFRD